MIRKFRHKGLDALFTNDSKKGIPAHHLKRISRILTMLNAAVRPQDMNLPGYNLHELTGKHKGIWTVTVSGNWRITFSFIGKDAYDVDLVDYH